MFVPATSGANKSNSIIKLSLLLQQKQFINKPNQCLLLQLQEQTNLTVLLNNYFCTLNAKPYKLKRMIQTVNYLIKNFF
jgi:hypothetical protein